MSKADKGLMAVVCLVALCANLFWGNWGAASAWLLATASWAAGWYDL